jgi:hypothetical protein
MGRGDRLDRLAVLDGEDGAQRFVAADDLGQAARQHRRVERAVEAHGHGDVEERGVGSELLRVPDPPLVERGRPGPRLGGLLPEQVRERGLPLLGRGGLRGFM